MLDSKLDRWLLAALLIVQAILLTINAWRNGPGWDEWGHLPSGLYSLQYGDHHPYRVNPPLARLIAAVPALLSGGGIAPAVLPRQPGFRSEALLSMRYVHQHGEDVFHYMSVARMVVLPIALAGTLLLWRAGNHFGRRPVGLFAAALWVFSPMVLTYGSMITPDLPAAVFGFWAAWCLYAWLRLGRWREAVWLAIALALAMLSKATWVFLPPVLVIIATAELVRIARRYPRRKTQVFRRLGQATAITVLTYGIVHACYDFRGMAQPIGEFEFISRTLAGPPPPGEERPRFGNRFRGSWVGRLPSPLPTDYVAGMDVQKRDFESKPGAYLLGQRSEQGYYYYYVLAWLFKEPVAFWLILVIGWIGVWSAGGRPVDHSACRWGLAIVLIPGLLLFVFVSSQTGFNRHLRYVLPAFPAALLVAALPIRQVSRSYRIALMALLAWFCVSSVWIVPRSYAFFSEAIGGAGQGHRYLHASNLHWGQDLLSIKRWLEQNPEKRPAHLIYAPSQLDLRRLGVDAELNTNVDATSGPRQSGWWIVAIDNCLDPPNRWFLSQQPTERITVSTAVYHISKSETAHGVLDRPVTPRDAGH